MEIIKLNDEIYYTLIILGVGEIEETENYRQTIDGENQVLHLADKEITGLMVGTTMIMEEEEETEDTMDTVEGLREDTTEAVTEDKKNLMIGPNHWPGMTDSNKNCFQEAPVESTLTSTRTFLSRPQGLMSPRILSHLRMCS